MYRFLSFLLLIAAFVYFFLSLRKNRIGSKEIRGMFAGGLAKSLAGGWTNKDGSLYFKLKLISYYITVFLFLVLFITGMFPAVALGVRMTGLFLMIHVESALLFTISFTVTLVFWAHRHQFTDAEMPHNRLTTDMALKLLFWLITLLIIIAMLSIILMLFPLFGTDGMENLVDIHRYSVLFLSVTVIFHSYYLILHNRKRSQ